MKAAPKNGKPKRAHDRWEEYENYVSEYKSAKKEWPTISEATSALQKRRKLASEKDWVFVAKHYNIIKGKTEKDEPFVTSELAEGGCQLALQTLAAGKAHSLYRLHPKEIEAYAKKTGKPLPEKAKEDKKAGK
jgi:hypothetical protein